MAYARYDRGCDWYIFWESTNADEERAASGSPKPKSEQVLAIWHSSHRSVGPSFTYSEVREMLASGDFSRIPGFDESSRSLLLECMTEFIHDVNNDNAA